MQAADAPSQLLTLLQIIVADLLLSADNAVVVALACRQLRPQDRRRGYAAAMLAAVAMRLLFASGIVFILQVPLLQLLGGVALLVIAVRLAADAPQAPPGGPAPASGIDLWRVVTAVLVGDAAMSLDNVVAVAALANGSVALLAAGIAVSVPLLVYGSAALNRLIDASPALVLLAGAMLGWIAGSIAVSDPAVGPWVAQQAPALALTLPAGAAALVVWQALILRPRSATVPPQP